jgi:hypothetical protein
LRIDLLFGVVLNIPEEVDMGIVVHTRWLLCGFPSGLVDEAVGGGFVDRHYIIANTTECSRDIMRER